MKKNWIDKTLDAASELMLLMRAIGMGETSPGQDRIKEIREEINSLERRLKILREEELKLNREYNRDKPKPVSVDCLGYGCKNKATRAVFCEECYLDYLEDPDAYK